MILPELDRSIRSDIDDLMLIGRAIPKPNWELYFTQSFVRVYLGSQVMIGVETVEQDTVLTVIDGDKSCDITRSPDDDLAIIERSPIDMTDHEVSQLCMGAFDRYFGRNEFFID